MWESLGAVVTQWGPETLLTVLLFFIVLGKLNPSRVSDKLIKKQEEFYEGRIADLKDHHREVEQNLRASNDATRQALEQAIQNNMMLANLVNEYSELTRVATPALIARLEVLEGRHDS